MRILLPAAILLLLSTSQASAGSEKVLARFSLTDEKSPFFTFEDDPGTRQVPRFLAAFPTTLVFMNTGFKKLVLANYQGEVTTVIPWAGDVPDRFRIHTNSSAIVGITPRGVWTRFNKTFRLISGDGYEAAKMQEWPLETGRPDEEYKRIEFADAVIHLPFALSYWQRSGNRMVAFVQSCACVKWLKLVENRKGYKPEYSVQVLGEWKLPERKTEFIPTSDEVTGGDTVVVKGPQPPRFTTTLDVIYASEERNELVVRQVRAP